MSEGKEFLCSDTEEHYLNNGHNIKYVPTLYAFELNGKIQIDANDVEDSVSVTFTTERAKAFANELLRLVNDINYTK